MPARRTIFTPLWFGIVVPVLYFGAQIVRGPFVDGYSFRRHAASDLGASGVPGAIVFNVLAVAAGMCSVVAAFGWYRAFTAWRVGRIRRALVSAAVVSIGLASIAAGMFPLPDARHGGGAVGVGLFALPLLLVIATFRSDVERWVRWYAMGNLALFAVAALLFAGATPLDPTANEGAFQRVLACAVFLPIAVVSTAALRDGRLRHPEAVS